jgi:hypothetical protein
MHNDVLVLRVLFLFLILLPLIKFRGFFFARFFNSNYISKPRENQPGHTFSLADLNTVLHFSSKIFSENSHCQGF